MTEWNEREEYDKIVTASNGKITNKGGMQAVKWNKIRIQIKIKIKIQNKCNGNEKKKINKIENCC